MLIKITTASPPYEVKQSAAAEELKKRMAVTPVVGRMIDMASHHSGIDRRFVVIPDGDAQAPDKFYSSNGQPLVPDTKLRMNEYERWSKQLAVDAVGEILKDADPAGISRLITVSCTGFFAPGLDAYLIERFQIPRSAKRENIGFMGCAASLIGFHSVFESMAAGNGSGTALLVSVELCSLHLQMEPTRDNILANMIFADGCAAALFDPGQTSEGLAILSTSSFFFPQSSEYMGWKVGNTGFEMILSSDLPKIILGEAVPRLKAVLEEQNLRPEEITHWALHPGGRAILDALQKGMQLSDEQMIPSRTVLREFGNLSSASILFVLKEIMASSRVRKGDLVCAVAFGPGLTMETAILRAC